MKTVKVYVAALMVGVLCGCASTPNPGKMIYSGRVSGRFNTFLVNEVGVANTTRGRQLDADKSSEIRSEDFGLALKESLREYGLFSESGRFQLEVRILKIIQPPGRFDMKVTTHVAYTLVDSTSDKIVFQETIIADHTAYTAEALSSVKRRRLANEGSGRRNIAQFLNQLSQL